MSSKHPLGTKENPIITESAWWANHKARIRQRDAETAERWAQIKARGNGWKAMRLIVALLLLISAISYLINLMLH